MQELGGLPFKSIHPFRFSERYASRFVAQGEIELVVPPTPFRLTRHGLSFDFIWHFVQILVVIGTFTLL